MRFNLLTVACAACLSLVAANPWGPAPKGPASNGKTCTVKAHGNKKDDTPQILEAFENCNNGGTVVFPEGENYWIATKLNSVVYDVSVEWRGMWTVCDQSQESWEKHANWCV